MESNGTPFTDTFKEKPYHNWKINYFENVQKYRAVNQLVLAVWFLNFSCHQVMMSDYFISCQESEIKNFESYISTLISKKNLLEVNV